jgi:Rhodopirellula transposase DDE domain
MIADCVQWPNPRFKKTDETDAIFENVRHVNALADADVHTLRISIDTKATVHVGEYSRGGRSRGVEAVKALDHDMCMKQRLVPAGILEPVTGKSFLYFGTNYKTSDFMADGLLLWWKYREPELPEIKQLVINLDNGPECNGRRSQFLLRMTEFADLTGLCVRLVYYPPYLAANTTPLSATGRDWKNHGTATCSARWIRSSIVLAIFAGRACAQWLAWWRPFTRRVSNYAASGKETLSNG